MALSLAEGAARRHLFAMHDIRHKNFAGRSMMRTWLKRGAIVLAIGAGLAFTGKFGWHYWTVGRFLESTDDAYVQADYTTISPKVSGYISTVLVSDNESVHAGQILARIDDRDFATALNQAKADVATAEADVKNIDAQLALQKTLVDEASANIDADKAAATFAKQDYDRFHALVGEQSTSVQRYQQAVSDYQQKIAGLHRDQSALNAAKQKIGVLQAQRAKAQAQLQHNKALERQAELNLGYTTIRSPIAGMVGARSLRVGQFVQAGTPLMAVVPLRAVYIIGNFKETQLTHVRKGQPAEIDIDTFPGMAIKGHVDSIAPASGLTFALLPPDNATGNFTKIVQRIPVKITLDPDATLIGRLRPGMSVQPTIDTKATVIAEGKSNVRLVQADANQGAAH